CQGQRNDSAIVRAWWQYIAYCYPRQSFEGCENFRAILCNQYGVFKMRRNRAITGTNRPPIFFNIYPWTAQGSHWLNCYCHTCLKHGTGTGFANIRNIRILMQFMANPMAYQVAHNTILTFV